MTRVRCSTTLSLGGMARYYFLERVGLLSNLTLFVDDAVWFYVQYGSTGAFFVVGVHAGGSYRVDPVTLFQYPPSGAVVLMESRHQGVSGQRLLGDRIFIVRIGGLLGCTGVS